MPEAQAASKAEWQKLRNEDSGRGCWDESQVREYTQVVEAARKDQKKVHMARLFEIVGVKHWEKVHLRKAKARVVCQGNNVRTKHVKTHFFFPGLWPQVRSPLGWKSPATWQFVTLF